MLQCKELVAIIIPCLVYTTLISNCNRKRGNHIVVDAMTRVCSAIAIPPGEQGEDVSLLLITETDYAAERIGGSWGRHRVDLSDADRRSSYHSPGSSDEGNSRMDLVASYR